MKTDTLDIRHADCMQLMREYGDSHFDLAIVDPPYGIDAPNMNTGDKRDKPSTSAKPRKAKFSKGSGKLRNRALNAMRLDWDTPPGRDYFEELFRVSRHQIIWGGNYFDLPPTRGIICWDKRQPWENFSQWEMAWTSFNRVARLFACSNTGRANAETKIHPTQKPVKLYQWLLANYAETGWKILDTHLGSGSIAIAAHYAGVHLTACERDAEYYQAACQRIEIQTRQTSFL